MRQSAGLPHGHHISDLDPDLFLGRAARASSWSDRPPRDRGLRGGLTVDDEGGEATVRVYDGAHGVNDLHRHNRRGEKAPATLPCRYPWGRDASRDRRGSRRLQGDNRRMAHNVNPSESPTAKAMDRAIDLAIEGNSPYPEHAAFIDAESPHAGHEITRVFDEGYAVVLVSADRRERVITAKTLAASA